MLISNVLFQCATQCSPAMFFGGGHDVFLSMVNTYFVKYIFVAYIFCLDMFGSVLYNKSSHLIESQTRKNQMKFSSLVEVISASSLAYLVFGDVSKERGGVMLVAPPSQLKTTAIEYLDHFPKCRIVSNMTVKTLTAMRQDFISGEISTMAFPDYDMIYKRHDTVSHQIEGTLMSLMGEGFRNPAFSDQRVSVLKARCTIIGGVTVKCYEENISRWIDSGFARRFLWCRYWVGNPSVIEHAITQWKRHELVDGNFIMKLPSNNVIPYALNPEKAARVLMQIKYQHDKKLPYINAQKIISVLCWKHGEKKGWQIWDDFAPTLGQDGSEVLI
jgi:hypothetical protein